MPVGRLGTPVITLVERQLRFVVLVRLPTAGSTTIVNALVRRIRRLSSPLRQSLTWDQGKGIAQHKRLTVATELQGYFCDLYGSWQRGSNGNTNGLLQQYFPTGGDLSIVTRRQLDAVALGLNTRRRRALDWRTPAEVLDAAVASTG